VFINSFCILVHCSSQKAGAFLCHLGGIRTHDVKIHQHKPFALSIQPPESQWQFHNIALIVSFMLYNKMHFMLWIFWEKITNSKYFAVWWFYSIGTSKTCFNTCCLNKVKVFYSQTTIVLIPLGVSGVMVSIVAFQAVDRGSIPRWRIPFNTVARTY
jgi:hypothetical protein